MPKQQIDPGTVEAVTAAPKPFTAVLAMMEGGSLQHDAADHLRQLTTAMSEHTAQHGKAKGTFTLILELKQEGDIVSVVGDVKVKAPKLKRETSIFWLTPNNDLTQQNPKQLTMGLREAPAPAPVKEPSAAPAAVKGV